MSVLERVVRENISVDGQLATDNEKAALAALIDYVVETTCESQRVHALGEVEAIRNSLSSFLRTN